MLTNLISIGDNSELTGHLDAAFPAAGNDGLSAHGDFEGTRFPDAKLNAIAKDKRRRWQPVPSGRSLWRSC